jgi:hypothetical protein
MWLDLDLDPLTGFVSDEPDFPTNDIGADAAVLILPAYLSGMAGEELSLPVQRSNGERQLETESAQALSAGLSGLLYLWDPYYEWLDYAGDIPVITDTDYFWFAIPLDMLDDDGIMAVVNLIGDSWELTDVAPNEGHGIVYGGEACDLTIHSTAGGSVVTPGEGAFTYAAGTAVKLVVTSDVGYRFVEWTGDVDTIANVRAAVTTITMSGNYSITAKFSLGACFIATAAYGTDTAKEIDILREFRDTALLPNSLGARFVSFYYETSPPIADFISQHEFLRTAARVGFVDPIVRIISWSHDLWSPTG